MVVFQLGGWPELFVFLGDMPRWEALKDLNSLLLIVGLAYLVGCSLLFYRWLHANVPLASHRQATLDRRSIDDHVPRKFQYAVYGVLVLHLAVWIAVGVMGLYTTHAFWGAMAFQFVITGLCVFFAIGAVRRSPGAIDRSLGPGYRQTEVRVAFGAQLLPLLNGAVRLYEQVSNTPPEVTERFLHLGVGPFHIHWRAGSSWRNALKTLDDPEAGSIFKFRKGERVVAPRGSGRIRQGYDSGEIIGYEIDGDDNTLFMAEEQDLRRPTQDR